jgi:hypothetical protein
MGRKVWADGPLEYDYLHLLEADPEVSLYVGQPVKFRYILAGEKRVRTYTPDFLVGRSGKIQIVEVKLEKDAQDEWNQMLFRMATRACRETGCEVVIASDALIRAQPRLNNLKKFRRYASTPINAPNYESYCREFFKSEIEASFDEAQRYFESKKVPSRVLYALLYHGVLAVDLMKPFNGNSLITFPALTKS